MRDAHAGLGPVNVVRLEVLDELDDLEALDHLAELHVLSVEMRRWRSGSSKDARRSAGVASDSKEVKVAYMKNWDPFVFSPLLAMESRNGLSCFMLRFSSKGAKVKVKVTQGQGHRVLERA